MMDDEDDWGRLRMGRLSNADERLAQRLMGKGFMRSVTRSTSTVCRRFKKSQGARHRDFQAAQLASRTNTVGLGLSYRVCPQAIAKVGFCPKSRISAHRQILYVTRLRDEDRERGRQHRVGRWDEFGRAISEDAVMTLTQDWNLTADEDNLSKAVRNLRAGGNAAALQQIRGRNRLRHIQTWHFILSICESEEDGVFEPFRAAVRTTVDELFTANGHRVLWTVHADHTDRLHAHVIVKAQSELGRRLHSDIHGDYLHGVRVVFAKCLRLAGLDYEATRRIDRMPVRERIMAGMAALNNNRPLWKSGPYSQLKDWGVLFGGQAVSGMKQLATAKQAALLVVTGPNAEDRIQAVASVLRDELNKFGEQASIWRQARGGKVHRSSLKVARDKYPSLFARLSHMYHDPVAALASWQRMALENVHRDKNAQVNYPTRALASWTLRKRPEMFGPVKTGAFEEIGEVNLKWLLQRTWLPQPEQVHPVLAEDSFFTDYLAHRQTHRARKKVLYELQKLEKRVADEFGQGYRQDIIHDAIDKALRIPLTTKLLSNKPKADWRDVLRAIPLLKKPLATEVLFQKTTSSNVPQPLWDDPQQGNKKPKSKKRRRGDQWGR